MELVLIFLVYTLALSVALGRRGIRSAATRGVASASEPAPAPERVLIVGATGGTGRQLVEQALERGYTVTALARDPSALRVDHPRLTVIQGNVRDYPSVEAAMRGQDAVLSALGHNRYLGPSRILSEGTRNVVRAMEAHRVQRFVCETALGIGDSAGRLGLYYTLFVVPVVLPFYFWDKARQERVIAASRLHWVVVRPGLLTNGARRSHYRHGKRVGSFLATVRISRADVADFMLNQLTADAYLREAVGVCW